MAWKENILSITHTHRNFAKFWFWHLDLTVFTVFLESEDGTRYERIHPQLDGFSNWILLIAVIKDFLQFQVDF